MIFVLRLSIIPESEMVTYGSSLKAKWRLLRKGFTNFSKRDTSFLKFCEDENEWLLPYCKFRWLMEMAGTESWEHWSDDYNSPEKAE